MQNYFTNYHTATCFDTTVSLSGSLKLVPCKVTQVFQMQLLVIQLKISYFTQYLRNTSLLFNTSMLQYLQYIETLYLQ